MKSPFLQRLSQYHMPFAFARDCGICAKLEVAPMVLCKARVRQQPAFQDKKLRCCSHDDAF